MQHLHTQKEFDSLITETKSFIIFKHSPTCGISGGACKTVHQVIQKFSTQNIYQVDVVNNRELSLYIAQYSSVTHESPQILSFKDKKIISHASHYEITQEYLQSIL